MNKHSYIYIHATTLYTLMFLVRVLLSLTLLKHLTDKLHPFHYQPHPTPPEYRSFYKSVVEYIVSTSQITINYDYHTEPCIICIFVIIYMHFVAMMNKTRNLQSYEERQDTTGSRYISLHQRNSRFCTECD